MLRQKTGWMRKKLTLLCILCPVRMQIKRGKKLLEGRSRIQKSRFIRCSSPSVHCKHKENSSKNHPGGLSHCTVENKVVPIFSNPNVGKDVMSIF